MSSRIHRASAPGLLFLLKSCPSLLLPVVSSYGVLAAFRTYLNVFISWPVQLVIYIISIPAYFTARVLWKVAKDKRTAHLMGAIEVPILTGRLPGNLDIAREWEKSFIGRKYLGYVLEGEFERLGPIWNSRFFWENLFHTSQPEHVKTMLTTDFAKFAKGETFQETFRDLLGTGIVNSDGDMWQFHRSMIRPFFAKDKVIQYSIFERTANKAITLMLDRLQSGQAIDIQDLSSRYTFDSTTEFLFSMDSRTLEEKLPYPYFIDPQDSDVEGQNSTKESRLFSDAFVKAQDAVSSRLQLGSFWPLREFTENWSEKPMSIVDSFLFRVFKDYGKKASDVQDIDEEDQNLLDELIKSTDDQVIWRDQVINLFIAARDTTSALITFAVYSLAKHPNILSRLRTEILERLGSDRTPTFDDIKEMKYLRAVINETLRMYPPNPTNVRESVEDTTFPPVTPGGKSYFIPAKTKVMYHTFAMHRRKDLWGPDALEFDPDRWIDDRLQQYFLKNPFIFLPFNAGPRICPGQQFALNESSFFIIRLLQTFQNINLDLECQPPEWRPLPSWIESRSGTGFAKEPVLIKSNLTTYAKEGLWVKLR